MAEQASRISDQHSGDYIATRDAIEQDADGNSRVIQIVDFASRQLISPTTIRGISSFVTVQDSVDLSSLPAELTSNLLTSGDKSTLLVFPQHTANNGEVYVTPIIFNSGGTAIGIRATKASAMGTALFILSGVYYSPQLSWDLQGAEKIGLHITTIGGTANTVRLLAGVI